jgi:hypothetical protein
MMYRLGHWADENYWKGGWRSWLANRIVEFSNTGLRRFLLP